MNGHTYRFTWEDLERIYEQFNTPENDQISFSEYEIKCPSCGWVVSAVYVLASSYAEAERLIADGQAGICAECYADMLADRAPVD